MNWGLSGAATPRSDAASISPITDIVSRLVKDRPTITPVPAQPPPEKGEQRREPRYLPQKSVEILPCRSNNDFEFEAAELVDCSASGIGLVVQQPMQPGEHFLLKLKMARWLLLLYVVRCCDHSGEAGGGYRIGGELVGHADSASKTDPQKILTMLAAEDDDASK